MKNLRKQHPLLKPFRQQVQQKAETWLELDQQARLDLCLQFILLPLIEQNKSFSQNLIDKTMPAAVDLERLAGGMLEEGAVKFSSIRDLLEKTAGLFAMGQE